MASAVAPVVPYDEFRKNFGLGQIFAEHAPMFNAGAQKTGETLLRAIPTSNSDPFRLIDQLLIYDNDTSKSYLNKALDQAFQYRKETLIKLLLSKGATIDRSNPLIKATEKRLSNELILSLMDKYDINQQDDLGNTALIYACFSLDPTVALELIRRGADINIKGSTDNAVSACGTKSVMQPVLKKLIDRKATSSDNAVAQLQIIREREAAAAGGRRNRRKSRQNKRGRRRTHRLR